jgi:hypothetical protein
MATDPHGLKAVCPEGQTAVTDQAPYRPYCADAAGEWVSLAADLPELGEPLPLPVDPCCNPMGCASSPAVASQAPECGRRMSRAEKVAWLENQEQEFLDSPHGQVVQAARVIEGLAGVRGTVGRVQPVMRSRPQSASRVNKPSAKPTSTTSLGSPELAPIQVLPPYRSGVTPLREYDIDYYGQFGAGPRRNDGWFGHEVLGNNWLEAHGYGPRHATAASRMNPALAVNQKTHAEIGRQQRALRIWNAADVRGMSATENIRLNGQAMRNAGVPENVVRTIESEALKHAASLPPR